MDLTTVAKLLGGEAAAGQVRAPGPGHSPEDRSLSVKLDPHAPDGFIVNSFTTDDPIACRDYVRKKLNLPAFTNGSGRRRASNDSVERALMAAVAAQSVREQKPKGIHTTTYPYRDADGSLLYEVLRYEQPKDFRQRRPDGKGGWITKQVFDGVKRVVYRWPELLTFPDASVFIPEGEKDCNRLWDVGLVATCVAGGVWATSCVEALAGRDVCVLEDHDEPGRKKALQAAQALHSVAKSIRIVELPGLGPRLPHGGKDVSDWFDADQSRDAEKLCQVCFDAPLWQPTSESIAAAADTTETKTPESIPLPFINIAAWHDQPIPEREWTVKDRIPANNVTLLSGEGSVGKSILSLHLAITVVLGRDWLGTLPEPGPALVVCCEDDDKELWRRLDLILQHYGASFIDISRDMHLLALAGEETLMATPNSNGLIQPTKLFGRIHEAACDIKPKLIVLDNSADIFGGNENDRAQVRQFIALLRGMAIKANAGVLLTSHPSLTGISNKTGLSGSTAWNASVRSRLYFKRAVTEKDEEPDPDLRVLEVMKSNYGPIGETITLRWKDGLFVPVGGVTNLEKLAAEQVADNLFLTLLNRFNLQGRNLSNKPSANNYAPAEFAKEKEAKDGKIRKSDFEAAMRRLFAADKIHVENYGSASRGTSKLVLK
jgi:RecA-family ATPase